MSYHDPVMLKECTEALNINPTGTYADATFGGGGHSKEILKNLTSGTLIAFDQDQDSAEIPLEDKRLIRVNQNFKFLANFIHHNGFKKIDGLLADLGISSHQIDVNDRGFAFRMDGPLDMRMNRNQDLSAKEIINTYSEEKLSSIFREYGELKNAKKLARKIVNSRGEKEIQTTEEFLELIDSEIPDSTRNKFLARVFQALRIEVNGEIEALKRLLNQCPKVIREEGRIVFITYHSLEDRLVKNFIKAGNFNGIVEKDLYGNPIKPFEAVNRKPLYPSDAELEKNNRSRSAKLRIAKRLGDGQ